MSADDPRITAGLAAQATARDTLLSGGARRLGWKAGFGTAAALEKLGTSAPLVGFLTDRTLVLDGAVGIDGWEHATLEPELAIRVGADVAPGASRDEVLAAIDAIGPAIELIDPGAADDVEAILAGNIFHRAVLLGEMGSVPDGGVDTARLAVHVDGEPVALDVDPSDVVGPLVDVVRALADQLPLAGDRMRAGDVIITGSAIPALALTGGERVEVVLQGAGSVAVAIG